MFETENGVYLRWTFWVQKTLLDGWMGECVEGCKSRDKDYYSNQKALKQNIIWFDVQNYTTLSMQRLN